MYAKTIIAAGALLSMVAAVPLQQEKRDLVWTTKVEQEIVTIDVTTTVWLSPGETAPANSYEGAEPEHYGGKGHGHGHKHSHKSKKTSHIHTTVTVPAPSSAAPVPTSTYAAPAPSSQKAAPSSEKAAPSSEKSGPSSAAPAPSSAAPAPSSYQAPAPSSAAPAAPSSYVVPGKNSAPSGETYTGDITYYAPGLGSCGKTNSANEAVVAVAENMMLAVGSANPNDNPYCGKSIMISYNGKDTPATIVDTCPGCAGASIDLSPSLFKKVAPHGDGRVHNVKWWFT